MTIFVDVKIVIIVHKIVVLYLPINSKGSYGKEQANQNITMFDDKFLAAIISFGHGKIAGGWQFRLLFSLRNSNPTCQLKD